MARMYSFVDEWVIDAPLDKTWQLVLDPAHWQRWWKGLQSAEVSKRAKDTVGSKARLTWRSRSGYRLSHHVTITAFEPMKSITFTSSGDLIGHGAWEFQEHAGQTHMKITWQVETSRPWMKLLGPLLAPVFRYNHNLLMAAGEKGLNSYLHRY